MTGVRKFIACGRAEAQPPANLWDVLQRGNADTFPLHTALWLFKNAQGDTGAFRHMPGPSFNYRMRDPNAEIPADHNCAFTLQVLAWFLCLPAYGKGHLPAGPIAAVYGCLTEGFLEPPAKMPTEPEEFPEQVRDLLAEATFPLSELPALTMVQLACFFAVKFVKYASIFGPLESQLIRRAQIVNRGKYVPEEVERDVQKAVDRAMRAFEMPSLQDWEYDQVLQGYFIKNVRCHRRTPRPITLVGSRNTGRQEKPPRDTSPYSPPFWGLPIFDLRPLFQEALRLIKLVPEQLDWCPSLPFMDSEDWERCHRFRMERRFSKSRRTGFRSSYPKNADECAAWDWIESIYGLRVRPVLYPSDRRLKSRISYASEGTASER
jgi:hypothetical protein